MAAAVSSRAAPPSSPPCRPPNPAWSLGSGIASVATGVAALAGTVMVPDATPTVLGLALLSAGTAQAAMALANSTWQGADVVLVGSHVLLAAGLLLCGMPGLGLDPVMVVTGAVLVAAGILEGGFGLRRCAGPGRTWLVLSGAGQCAAGIAVWMGLPTPQPWGLGTAVAAGLCVVGLGRLGLGGGAREWSRSTRQPPPRRSQPDRARPTGRPP